MACIHETFLVLLGLTGTNYHANYSYLTHLLISSCIRYLLCFMNIPWTASISKGEVHDAHCAVCIKGYLNNCSAMLRFPTSTIELVIKWQVQYIGDLRAIFIRLMKQYRRVLSQRFIVAKGFCSGVPNYVSLVLTSHITTSKFAISICKAQMNSATNT